MTEISFLAHSCVGFNNLILGVGPGRSVSQGEGASLWFDQGTILTVDVTNSGSVFENRAPGPEYETAAGLLTTVRGSIPGF
jgi:hypothetical protein